MKVREVLRQTGIPRAQVARDSGLSRAALEAWISSKRSPEPGSLRQLAAGLRRRAELLQELASELEGEAE